MRVLVTVHTARKRQQRRDEDIDIDSSQIDLLVSKTVLCAQFIVLVDLLVADERFHVASVEMLEWYAAATRSVDDLTKSRGRSNMRLQRMGSFDAR